MLTLWETISTVGLSRKIDASLHRNIILTNRIASIAFLLNLLLFILNFSQHGWTFFNKALLIGNIGALTSILVLNKFGFHVLSRLILSLMFSVYPFFTSVSSKLGNPDGIEEAMYFMPRMFIMITAIIPIIIFSFREKLWLAIGLSGSFIPLTLFDQIHNFFGIGYYQQGFSASIYPTFVAISIIGYLIFLTATIFFKRINESYEAKTYRLIRTLKAKNTELVGKNIEIEKQADQLESAYREIEIMNRNLEKVVNKRTKKLLDQAVQFQKFSYKNSHELRGPLTKVMSIIKLLNEAGDDTERQNLLVALDEACHDLDLVVHDINDLISEAKEELGDVY